MGQTLTAVRPRSAAPPRRPPLPSGEGIPETLPVDSRRLRQELVLANLGIVVRIARRYERLGLPLQDLVQEGVLGLFRAAALYDVRRGFRFSTYAKAWVKEAMTSSVALMLGPCKVPVPLLLSLSKLRAAGRRLSQELGREPELHEVTQAAGIARHGATRALFWGRQRMSLNAGAEEGSDLLHLLSMGRPPEPALSGELREGRIRSALGSIDERERHVLESRFGLWGRPAQTCRQVGSRLGLCPERIRQIEKSALRKLRKALETTGDPTDLF